jgi:peroxiredoxin
MADVSASSERSRGSLEQAIKVPTTNEAIFELLCVTLPSHVPVPSRYGDYLKQGSQMTPINLAISLAVAMLAFSCNSDDPNRATEGPTPSEGPAAAEGSGEDGPAATGSESTGLETEPTPEAAEADDQPAELSSSTPRILLRRIDPPIGSNIRSPALASSGNGLLLTWTERANNSFSRSEERLRLRAALFEDGRWRRAGTPVVSEHLIANPFDTPSAIVTRGNLVAHWPSRLPGDAEGYEIRVARSSDGGESWSEISALHADGTDTEHGFVSLVAEGSRARAFWLDGRNNPDGNGSTGLYTAQISDAVYDEELLDARVCDCCPTGAAIGPEGPIVVYRDRLDSDIRDISLVRRIGRTWSEPIRVHADGWELTGCPVNGPDVAADGSHVVVAWYTGANDRPRVLAAFSSDLGDTFGEPVEIDDVGALGRVQVIFAADGDAIVTWVAAVGDGNSEIRIRRASADGGVGPMTSIGNANGDDVPQMVRHEATLLVAWVNEDDHSRLSVVQIDHAAVPGVGETAIPTDRNNPPHMWMQQLGGPAPEYAVETLDGEAVALADYRGSVVLLNFWATWCGPCREEFDDLNALHAELGERGLQVIGVNVEPHLRAESLAAFLQENPLDYPVLRDLDSRSDTLFRVPPLPANFVFDRNGDLVYRRHGIPADGFAEVRQAIEGAL